MSSPKTYGKIANRSSSASIVTCRTMTALTNPVTSFSNISVLSTLPRVELEYKGSDSLGMLDPFLHLNGPVLNLDVEQLVTIRFQTTKDYELRAFRFETILMEVKTRNVFSNGFPVNTSRISDDQNNAWNKEEN